MPPAAEDAFSPASASGREFVVVRHWDLLWLARSLASKLFVCSLRISLSFYLNSTHGHGPTDRPTATARPANRSLPTPRRSLSSRYALSVEPAARWRRLLLFCVVGRVHCSRSLPSFFPSSLPPSLPPFPHAEISPPPSPSFPVALLRFFQGRPNSQSAPPPPLPPSNRLNERPNE